MINSILRLITVCLLITLTMACGSSDPIPSEGQGWDTRHGLSSADFLARNNLLKGSGYRLTYVSGHAAMNTEGALTPHYNAIWYEDATAPAWEMYHNLTEPQYQSKVDEMSRRGYQPVFVDGFNVGTTVYFVAIFEPATSAWEARHHMTSGGYQNEVDNWVNIKGYRIRQVSGYELNGEPYYAAIFDKSPGPAWVARHDMSVQGYQDEFDFWGSRGYQPVAVDGFFVGNTEYFTAIWHQKNDRYGGRHEVAVGDYQNIVNDFYYEGYEPSVVDAYSTSSGSNHKYTTVWLNKTWNLNDLDQINAAIENFRTANGIPSISIAITKDERLVYANAFGMADIENNEFAHTGHRYRVASLSKALTGAAVTRLIAQNQLALDDTVFGNGGVLGNSYGVPTNDVATIEVRDLMEHTGGGWCGAGSDLSIMFTNNGQTRNWLIADTLANIPLTGTPNTSFCYSNFGFSVLEAVIEASNGGTAYVQYVKDVLAIPSGATSLEVAGNTLNDRLPNEVKYYDFFDPYFWNVTRMAGHGGWLATPIDYLRIMTRVDGLPNRADILGPVGIDIYSRDDRTVGNDAWNITNGFYTKGLVINNSANRWEHNGNITGTLAEFMRYDDGFSIMLVINMRQPPSGNANSPRPALKQLGIDIHDANYNYPGYNRF